ncbi:cytochrome P450 [Aspergillus ustus]|uniref:Cytochrome P450 n=1 Tax=Aspergillus ustus TaxID=40382 RepID=A0A0C1C425_ASPUT|nr:cytochrome P450 [Aspergillus ustus]
MESVGHDFSNYVDFLAQRKLSIPQLRQIILILVGTVAVYFIADAIYSLFFHPLASVPGPFINRISKLPWDYWQWSGRLPQRTAEVHLKYGHVVRIAPNELSFSNQEAWHDIFAKVPGREQWPRHPRRVPQGKGGPKSIMNTTGSEHARFRRLLNYAFSEKGLQEQQKIISKYIDIFIDKVDNFAKSGETINITDWLVMVGFDVISDLGWSEPFNCIEKGEVHPWMQTFAQTAFDSQMKFLFREHGLMWLAPYCTPKRFQLARLNNFKYARNRIEDRIQNGGIRGDFWDRIDIKSVDDNASGEGLTKAEMVVSAVTLVGTGSETISTLLTGLVYFLGTNPHAMNKLVEEIRTTFSSADEVDHLSVQKLKYLTACLEETMRLYPPVTTLLWRVPPKGGGHTNGLYIPEGIGCNMSLRGIALSPEYFHRAYDFCPERFLANPPAEFKNENHKPYHPFSVGAYNCLGQNLANAESRLIITKILLNYNIHLDKDTPKDWTDQLSWAVFVKKPLYLTFSPRKA